MALNAKPNVQDLKSYENEPFQHLLQMLQLLLKPLHLGTAQNQ
jgi:hypothetical protein